MADRVSRFELVFDGEAGTIDAVLNGVKTSVRNAVADIEKTAGKLDLFGDIARNLPTVQAALDKAKEKVAAFRAEIDSIKSAGAVPLKSLTDGLAAAEKAAAGAQKEFNKQTAELAKLDVQLKAAGVDSKNLALAQEKLAAASKAAAAAAEQQAAKQLLAFKSVADVQPQITKLQAAFETLRNSGTLSAKEIAAAQIQLQAKIRETNAEVTKLGGGVRASFGPEASSLVSGFAARFLAVGTATAALTAGFAAASAAAKEYKSTLAEIGSVTNLTKEQLDDLGLGVRGLATTFGLDLQESLKAVFELIRSGVPADNAIQVLAVSAAAAKASLTDIGTAAKVSALLIDGFGLEVGELRAAFDALVQGSKDGGSTLKEFAANAGPLLNVARDLKVPFNDVVAVLTVMTDASNDAAGSASALTKILIKLADPEVRSKLRDLGITSTNVLDVFRQLGEQGQGIQNIIDLGLASTRTAAGVTALTSNAIKLAPELDKIAKSAGAAERAAKTLYDSPTERSKRFDAAIHETGVQFGLLVGSGSGLQDLTTRYINFANSINISDNVLSRWVARLAGVPVPLKAVTGDLNEQVLAFERFNAASKATETQQEALRKSLAETGDALLKQVEALQAASTRDITDINARAEAEIAALDRSGKAQADTAAKTLAIQTKLAEDRLAIIRVNETQILAAVDAAAAAQKKSAVETAQARIAALAPILKQYQDHYAALVALAQAYAAKVNAIGQERDSFVDSIRKRTDAIAAQGQSALEQYAANLKEIDRLIEASAVAAAKGEGARARQLTDEAIERSKLIKEVIGRDGEVIIGKYEAIATATNKTKKAEDGYLGSLDLQDDAAKAGFDAASKGIAEVLPKLKEMQQQYDSLKDTIANGLNVKVAVDAKALTDATAEIDKLTAPREIQITFKPPAEGPPTPTNPGFARGGIVGQLARGFAGGGAVFRRPLWSKVPGSGSGDTVPAALSSGSFVLRKAASVFYGDSLLSRLARGFATGGAVGMSSGGSPAEKFKLIHELKVEAQTEFQKILDRAAGLPHPGGMFTSFGGGQDVRDYVKRVLEIIASSQDPDLIKTLLDRVLGDYNRFDPAIEDAQRFHVPLVMGAFSSGPDGGGGDSQLFKDLSRKLTAGRNFAAGGSTDTIPAWLTPGEYVFNPRAAAMYGGGLLNAMNNMQVPRGFLAGMMNFQAPRPNLPRVAHFAEGGPVGSQAGGASRGGAAMGSNTFNFYGIRDDEDYVRTRFIPILDKIKGRGR